MDWDWDGEGVERIVGPGLAVPSSGVCLDMYYPAELYERVVTHLKGGFGSECLNIFPGAISGGRSEIGDHK